MNFGLQKKENLETLTQREIEILEQKNRAAQALASAEQAAAAALVDGDGSKEIEAVARLRAEIAAAENAITLLRARRAEVIGAANRAEAAKLRQRAGAKQQELDGLRAKTAKLLAEISKLEGVEYDVHILELQAATPLGIGAGCAQTRSDSLRGEILALESRATELESAAVPEFGNISLDGVTDNAEVVRAILQHPSAGPSSQAVAGWLTACANHPTVPSRTFGNMPRNIRITWRDGQIDGDNSSVFVPALTPRRLTGNGRDLGADVAAGTFQARRAA